MFELQTFVSYAFAIALPVMFLYVIWTLEIYTTSSSRILMLTFGWGMLSFLMAFVMHDILMSVNFANYEEISVFVAPVIEEVLKSFVLLALAWTMTLTYTTQGMTYGFAVGTGFAIMENLFFVYLSPEMLVTDVLARVLSVSLMHGFTSAILGTVLGVDAHHGIHRRVSRGFAILVVAIVLHAMFNLTMSTLDSTILVVVGIVIGLGGTAILMVLMRYTLRSERSELEHELKTMLSAGELEAALHPQEVASMLSNTVSQVDSRRADIIQRYVSLQARRGAILRLIHLNQRPRFADKLRHRLDDVERELTALRGDMGLFNWVWLRQALPSDESVIWSQLDMRLGTDTALIDLLFELDRRQDGLEPAEIAHRKYVLSHSKIFGSLSDDDLEDIAVLVEEIGYEGGRLLITQDSQDDHLYLLVSGHLTISVIDERGTETYLDTYNPGDYFGELSLIDGKPQPANIRSIDPVMVYRLSRFDFVTLIFAQPQIGYALMQRLVRDIRHHTEFVAWARATFVDPVDVPTHRSA